MGPPFSVAGLQAYTSEFPPLPSNCSNATKLLNPSLPKEISFAESLAQLAQQSHDSLRRDITMIRGIPQIKWTEEEVNMMNQIEELQFAVIGKFTHDWSDLEELRRIIPQQCDIKGNCQIGLLRTKHILIRLTKHEDFVNMISKGAFYIKCKDGYSYLMRTLIYDSRFKVDEETSMAMAWISFPNLLPTFFVKECLFSLAAAVGKPIQIDQATINKSRPSCARVKVIVDLRKDFPKVIKMNIENEATGEVRSNMVAIRYDYVPKYCFDCNMQGHSNEECRMRKMPQPRDGENFQYDRGGGTKSSDPPPVPSKLPIVHGFQKGKARVLSSGRVVGDPGQWDVVKDLRPPKYQLPVTVKNKFEVLTQNGDEEEKIKNLQATSEHENSSSTQTNKDAGIYQQGESSKEWVTRSFGKQNDTIVPDKHTQQRTTDNLKHLKGDELQQKSNEFEIIDTKVIEAVKEQKSESRNINVDRDEVQQKSNEIVVYANDLDEHAVSSNTNNQQKDLIISRANYVSEMELAIVEVPNIVQIDESHMIQMESPNRILHDIVSHNLEEIKSLESEENQIAKGSGGGIKSIRFQSTEFKLIKGKLIVPEVSFTIFRF
uniref:DNA/RNA binding protein n=1 Tax=Solanum tuberosum TaxID=4113 RepID=M1CMH9_SOLTU